MNKPQLSAEMEITILCSNCQQDKVIHTRFGVMQQIVDWHKEHKTRIGNSYCQLGHIHIPIKHFLATALEEQRAKHWFEMRKRCLLFGCVFGIPHIDKKPKRECIFCGEPGYIDQDTWLNESPIQSMQKTINELTKKYKTAEALQEYFNALLKGETA